MDNALHLSMQDKEKKAFTRHQKPIPVRYAHAGPKTPFMIKGISATSWTFTNIWLYS
jgi:hypothetical protein